MKRCVLVSLVLTAIFVWPLPFEFRASSDAPIALASEDPIPTEVHAGTVEDPWVLFNSATVRISWDNPYTTQTVRADFQAINSAGTVVAEDSLVGSELFPQDAERHELGVYGLAGGLANGVYQFKVRVWDENGNVSDWSQAIYVRKEWQELAPPGGCVILR